MNEDQKKTDETDNWIHSESSDSTSQILVKKESDTIDDEKEEGEIKDDEDDDADADAEDDPASEGNSVSPNPVNLSLNTKTVEDSADSEKECSQEVSTIEINFRN